MPNFCNSDGIGAGRYAGGNQSHGAGAETAAQHPPKAALCLLYVLDYEKRFHGKGENSPRQGGTQLNLYKG